MIKIEKKEEDLRVYLNNLFWSAYTPLVIISFIFIILSLILLLIGFLLNAKVLKYGYEAVMLLAIILIMNLRAYLFIDKKLKIFFKNSNGKVEYLISKEENEYIVNDITNGNVVRFKDEDIKSIKLSKKCIIIKLKSKEGLFFLKNNEIINLLKSN